MRDVVLEDVAGTGGQLGREAVRVLAVRVGVVVLLGADHLVVGGPVGLRGVRGDPGDLQAAVAVERGHDAFDDASSRKPARSVINLVTRGVVVAQ